MRFIYRMHIIRIDIFQCVLIDQLRRGEKNA